MITRDTTLVENTLIGSEHDTPTRLSASVHFTHSSMTIAIIGPHVKFPGRGEHDNRTWFAPYLGFRRADSRVPHR